MIHTYTLTEITGQGASERRTITFFTFDWKPRTLLVVGVSLVPALVVAVALWPLVGPFGLFVATGVVAVALWLFRTRARNNRDLTRYQDLRDRVASRKDIGKFYFAGREVDPLVAQQYTLAPGAISNLKTR